jgi:hypothetical protein
MPLAKELSLYFALGRSTEENVEDFAAGGEEKFYREASRPGSRRRAAD